jgi:hypothetical protein
MSDLRDSVRNWYSKIAQTTVRRTTIVSFTRMTERFVSSVPAQKV